MNERESGESMVSARSKLLFTCLHESSFVRTDIELLPERYRLLKYSGHGKDLTGIVALVSFVLKQLFWLIRHARGTDVFYGWFADYHMVLPVFFARLAGKPAVVVLAGFDSNHLPEIGYGVYASRWRAPAARYVLRNATILLPLTATLIYSENTYTTWPRRAAHGVRVHMGPDHAPYRAIGTGYDPARWPMGPPERPARVVTVAFVDSLRTAYVKGIDVYAATARQLPDVSFAIVGVPSDMERVLRETYEMPDNLTLVPPKGAAELAEIYAQSAVYAQLSRTEGVPSVVCEAMLCGCIPVGSRVFGIEEIIGDAGPLLDTQEPTQVAAAIRQALDMDAPAREHARRRIVERYHLGVRRRELFEALKEVDALSAR